MTPKPPAPAPPDDLTTALDQIRANHGAASAFGANAGDPVPLLIAAIEEAGDG